MGGWPRQEIHDETAADAGSRDGERGQDGPTGGKQSIHVDTILSVVTKRGIDGQRTCVVRACGCNFQRKGQTGIAREV